MFRICLMVMWVQWKAIYKTLALSPMLDPWFVWLSTPIIYDNTRHFQSGRHSNIVISIVRSGKTGEILIVLSPHRLGKKPSTLMDSLVSPIFDPVRFPDLLARMIINQLVWQGFAKNSRKRERPLSSQNVLIFLSARMQNDEIIGGLVYYLG